MLLTPLSDIDFAESVRYLKKLISEKKGGFEKVLLIQISILNKNVQYTSEIIVPFNTGLLYEAYH